MCLEERDPSRPEDLPLAASVLGAFLLQMAVIYVPACNTVFKTVPLTPSELGLTLLASTAAFLAVEVKKAVVRSRLKR